MRVQTLSGNEPQSPRSFAFTIPEVLFAVVCFSVIAVSLFTGLAEGFSAVKATQQNLRATQILQEQTEIIRLYTWEQISSNGFILTNFTAPFYAAGTQNLGGITYTGQISIADSPLTESYSNDVKLVTISLNWTDASIQRQRQTSTLLSRYGLHNYYYHQYP
jgi:type II secretory pathway pseudopilin PulG